jgi:DNA-binding MarR family transcriptional regulator
MSLDFKNLLTEMEIGRLSLLDFGLLVKLVSSADPETGIVVTNATRLAFETGSSPKLIQCYLVRLSRKGYIRRSARERSHSPYVIQLLEACWPSPTERKL